MLSLPTHGSKDSGNSFTINTLKNVGAAWPLVHRRAGRIEGRQRAWFRVGDGEFHRLWYGAETRRLAHDRGKRDSWRAGTKEPRIRRAASGTNRKTAGRDFQGKTKAFVIRIEGSHALRLPSVSRDLWRDRSHVRGRTLSGSRDDERGGVVIPIDNERGEILTYAGRSMDDAEPKYKFPAGFHKSQGLFNLHRAAGGTVIVAEGFFDRMKVHQLGIPKVVALMGSALSARQPELRLRFQRHRSPFSTATNRALRRRRNWARSSCIPSSSRRDRRLRTFSRINFHPTISFSCLHSRS
jgi:DNA primase catalytic core, N-terminal domain/Toprim domain